MEKMKYKCLTVYSRNYIHLTWISSAMITSELPMKLVNFVAILLNVIDCQTLNEFSIGIFLKIAWSYSSQRYISTWNTPINISGKVDHLIHGGPPECLSKDTTC